LHRLDCLGSHKRLDVYDLLVRESEELRRKPQMIPPLLAGADLLAMGMKPGPGLGSLLAEVREKQLQEELRTPDEARAWVRERMRQPLQNQ
jgi:hypothetical protein